jgi:hypothetical protein
MLNRSGDSGHPCLVPDFRRNGFSFSPLSINPVFLDENLSIRESPTALV